MPGIWLYKDPMRHVKGQARERGAAILLSMMVLVVLITSSVVALRPDLAFKQRQETRRSLLLKEAKEQLMAYAVTYADNYRSSGAGVGHLPCPDRSLDDARAPNPPCDSPVTRLGWLPQQVRPNSGEKLIEFFPADQTAEPLWYVVSEAFKNNPIAPVNSAVLGDLELDDQQDIVAIVIDPGPALAKQNRPSMDPRNYLEGENATAPYTRFVSHSNDQAFNDRLIAITRSELMPLIERRVLGFVQSWMLDFEQSNGYLPELSPMEGNRRSCVATARAGWIPSDQGDCQSRLLPNDDDPFVGTPHWFERNGWRDYIWFHYIEQCGYAQSNCASAVTTPLLVNEEAAKAVLVSRGQPLEAPSKAGLQQPHSKQWADYLDSVESADGDMVFDFERLGPTHNDQYLAW